MRPFFGRSKMSRVLSARARARARAPGPRVALGPPALFKIGDYDRLFACAQLLKNLSSLKISLKTFCFSFFEKSAPKMSTNISRHLRAGFALLFKERKACVFVFFSFKMPCPGYLARARARARAPGPRVALGPPALLTIGDYDQRLFARAQLSKNIFSLWGRSFISVSIIYCFV